MGREPDRPVTRNLLVREGMDWVANETFLATLDASPVPGALDALLAKGAWRVFEDGDVLASRDDGLRDVQIVMAGHVVLQSRGHDGAWVSTGRVDERAILGLVEVAFPTSRPRTTWTRAVANGRVDVLCLPVDSVRVLVLGSKDLREHVESVAGVIARLHEFVALLSRNPLLRPLGREDTERLLRAARLREFPRGARLLRANETPDCIHVVVRGRVATSLVSDGKRARRLSVAGPGDACGHEPVVLNRPMDLELVAQEQSQVLSIDREVFWAVLQRTPLALRLAQARLAALGLGPEDEEPVRAQAIFVGGAEPGLGVTTLAWGLAGRLARDEALQVTVVDLEGEETTARLGLRHRLQTVKGRLDGRARSVAVRRCPRGGDGDFDVMWPVDPEDEGLLVRILRETQEAGKVRVVVACGRLPTGSTTRAALEASDAVVVVRHAADRVRLHTHHRQARFQALRISLPGASPDEVVPYAPIPLSEAARAVRVPSDAASSARFWTKGAPRLPLDDDTVLGRACGRLARAVRGRSVGVALGGGGALGFAHVGLLVALHEARIPVDFVAGVSFGSVVGALYAGGQTPEGGLKMLGRLVTVPVPEDAPVDPEPLPDLLALNDVILAAAVRGTDPVGACIDRMTGGVRMAETEIPFYPLGMNLTTNEEFVLPDGTLGLAVQSASCMPGAWPALELGPYRIVDGGVISNVPASVLWRAGADFLLTSNIVTPDPGRLHPPLPELVEWLAPWAAGALREFRNRVPDGKGGRGWLARIPGIALVDAALQRTQRQMEARLLDVVHGMHALLAQNGRDRSLMADYGFDFEMRDVEVYDFLQAGAIATGAYRQAKEMQGEIRDSYAQDVSIRF